MGFPTLNPCRLGINFPIGSRFGFLNFNDEWYELDLEVGQLTERAQGNRVGSSVGLRIQSV